MTHRLNKSSREEILTRMLKHRFKAEVERYYDATAKLASKVYADIFDEKTQAEIVRLPVGWLAEDDHISVNFGSSGYTHLYFGGNKYGGAIRKIASAESLERRLPFKYRNRSAKIYEHTHPLTIEYTKLEQDRQRIVEKIEQAETIVNQTLNKVTTVERLVEVWPESIVFVQDFLKAEPRRMPTIRTDDLNEMLRLP